MQQRKVIVFFTCVVLLATAGFFFTEFLKYHQQRINAGGITFYDPIMSSLPRANVSTPIFTITYGCILYFLISRIKKPMEIAQFGACVTLFLLARIATLSLVPLEEPKDLVSLTDPILYDVIFSSEITADLFFSGHTAFIFTIYFLSKNKIVLVLGCILGILLMVQRVHFSIDIVGAILFSYLITRLVSFVFRKFEFK